MAESFEFDPADWVTAGAVGQPGERAFYLQARRGAELVSLLVEKTQVASLSQLAQQLLARLSVTVMPDDLDVAAQRVAEPVMPAWRVGALSLGMDPDGTRFVLEATQLPVVEDLEDPEADEEPAVARLWMNRDQLVALAAHAAYSVEAGARERCRFCDRPIDPVAGHVCPASNGHGSLSS